MKIELFPRAEADIVRQFRYYLVEQDSPATAIRFRSAVMKTLEGLRRHTRVGSAVQGAIDGLRSWPVAQFPAIRIYYLVSTDRLRVVRILHGSRDVLRVLKQG